MSKLYQNAITKWCVHTFGQKIAGNMKLRCFRFLEEACELVQSLGMTKEQAQKTIDYVWNRPVGEPHQEMGGVMVTLAALAAPARLDMEQDGWVELGRCWANVDKIRAKQASKAALGLSDDDPHPGVAPGSVATAPVVIEPSHVGRFVTLRMAVEYAPGQWLPQQCVWRIVGEIDGDWTVEDPKRGEVNSYIGYFRLPKHLCSEPRGEA